MEEREPGPLVLPASSRASRCAARTARSSAASSRSTAPAAPRCSSSAGRAARSTCPGVKGIVPRARPGARRDGGRHGGARARRATRRRRLRPPARPPPANPKQPKPPKPPRGAGRAPADAAPKGKAARKGAPRDEGTRALTPDEIDALRGAPTTRTPATPTRPPPPGRPGAADRRRLMPLEIDVLTLFPPMVEGPLGESIPARILERGLADRPRPRPARVGDRAPPDGRRLHVRRGRGHGPPGRTPSPRRWPRSAGRTPS